jgi:hypothetical protein
MRSSSVIGSRTDLLLATKVTSNEIENLFLDLQSTYVHQVGSISAALSVPAIGQTVSADVSQAYTQTTGIKTSVTNGNLQGYNDYDGVILTVSSFDSSLTDFPVGNFTLGTALSSSRSVNWGGTGQVQAIYHVVTATFADTAQMDYYFNAGGEIRFSASLTGGSIAKETDWSALLNAMGTVRFNKHRITALSGTPSPSGSGYDSLTGTYRQLFIKSGSGVYSDNDYTIEASKSSSVIRFRITFNDGNVGALPISSDDSVGGTTTNTVNTFRPDSSFVYNSTTYTAVNIPAPTLVTQVPLTDNNLTPPV